MELKLNYTVKSLVDVSQQLENAGLNPWSTSAELSRYDFESIVYSGVEHPRVTPYGSDSGAWRRINNSGGCIAWFNGLRVAAAGKNYSITARGEEYYASRIAVGSTIGALIVAFYTGRYTSIAYSTTRSIRVVEDAYKGIPVECSAGFKLFACTFRDGRSLVISESELWDLGVPARAIALLWDNSALVESSGWLVKTRRGEIKPITLAEGVFAGFSGQQPLFTKNNLLVALEGSSLVEIAGVESGLATGFGSIIVIDKGRVLEVLNQDGEQEAVLEKSSDTRCWASRSGILCCRGAFCGLVEPGESYLKLEDIRGEPRDIVVKAAIPVWVNGAPIRGDSAIMHLGECRVQSCRLKVSHLLGDLHLETLLVDS